MRSGVIAQKMGMTRVFTDAGEHVPGAKRTAVGARHPPARGIHRCHAPANEVRAELRGEGTFLLATHDPERVAALATARLALAG